MMESASALTTSHSNCVSWQIQSDHRIRTDSLCAAGKRPYTVESENQPHGRPLLAASDSLVTLADSRPSPTKPLRQRKPRLHLASWFSAEFAYQLTGSFIRGARWYRMSSFPHSTRARARARTHIPAVHCRPVPADSLPAYPFVPEFRRSSRHGSPSASASVRLHCTSSHQHYAAGSRDISMCANAGPEYIRAQPPLANEHGEGIRHVGRATRPNDLRSATGSNRRCGIRNPWRRRACLSCVCVIVVAGIHRTCSKCVEQCGCRSVWS